MKNYYVYKIEHIETGEFYIGSRGCICVPEEDKNYLGSMYVWKPDKNKLTKTILFKDFKTRESAVLKEAELIKEKINDSLNRNYHIPNKGYHVNGMMTAIDYVGNFFCISVDDIRLKTGELVSINKGKIVVKDVYNNKYRVSINDERYLNGELMPYIKIGKVAVKDINGNKFMVDKFDDRYLNGELVSVNKGKTMVKNKNNNKFFVDINDDRLISGELCGIRKGMSPINKGVPMSEEQKEKLRKPKPDTKEYKDKMSKALIGKRLIKILCLENKIIYKSIKEAAELLNLTVPNIVNVLKGRAKKTKGYSFKYIDDERIYKKKSQKI
jgi:hypothetical protein